MTPSPHALFISSRIVCRIVDGAAARGVDVDRLCRTVGIDPEELRDVDSRIDVERSYRLWGAAVTELRDPTFPLEVAANWHATQNLLRLVCMSSADLGAALERASRYLHVLTNAVSWPLEWRDDRLVLYAWRPGAGPPTGSRFAQEFASAEVVSLARAFTATEWNPLEVRFAWPTPEDAAPYEAFFQAPVRFACERSEVHVTLASLRLPLVQADPATVAFFEPQMDKLLGSNGAPRGLVDDVNDVIQEGLRGDAPTLESAAAKLGTSARTLRRRLQAEHHTFQALLDTARCSHAKRHIESGRLSLPEISFLLGFSEPSAFHRAFRRWTGTTPRSFARAQRSPGAHRAA